MRNEQNGLAGKYNRLYKIWHGIISRTSRPGSANYSRYGARGLGVAPEWREFARFVEWALANGYADVLSIDRIDNAQGYSPGNCRWATKKQQSRNRTDNILYEYQGRKWCLTEMAEAFGINFQTLRARVKSQGWDIARAIETPARRYSPAA